MLKDYIVSDQPERDETSFVEDHWTTIWQEKFDLDGNPEKVRKSEEYKYMRPYLERIPEKALLLDGGCGLGDWVRFLNFEGFHAEGVDISRITINRLKNRFPEIAFYTGDIRALDLPGDHVNLFFSWGVFEHFEDGPHSCLAEAFRILKPGGYLFMSVPHANVRQSMRASLTRASDREKNARFYQYRFTRAEAHNFVREAGFVIDAHVLLHKRQGVLRSLHHELGLPLEWILTRGLSALLSPILPGSWFSHMQLVIAQKPLRS